MSKEQEFSHHEACPSCLSKDNVGVWKDGHKYCFGCGWKSAGTNSVQSMKERLKELTEDDGSSGSFIDTSNHSDNLPVEVRKWLAKYGVGSREIEHYRLKWNTKAETLVFPMYRGSTMVLTSERYFGKIKDHPKYLTQGKKDFLPVFQPNPKTDVIVFVEDFVSAIKIARHTSCAPLLGATLNVKLVLAARLDYKRCLIWLDYNKAIQSIAEAAKASQYMSAGSIITLLDPKEYDDDEIATHIRNAS